MLRAAAVALLSLLVVRTAVAQESQPYAESIEVRVVNVEVVVTDGENRHVRNLTADDFELFENGRPQAITNFYEERDDATPRTTPQQAAAPSAVEPPRDAQARARYIVFFLDDYSTHPSKRAPLFDSLERFVDKSMRPGDQAMVVTWNRNLKIIVPFTSQPADVKEGIRKALKQAAGGYFIDRSIVERRAHSWLTEAIMAQATGKGMSFAQAYGNSVQAADILSEELNKRFRNLVVDLQETLRTLAGVDGRKALVFAGQQMPMQVNRELYAAIDDMFQPHAYQMRGIDVGTLILRASRYSQFTYHEELAREANTQGVALYMIHPAGMEPLPGAADSQPRSETVLFEEFSNTASAFNELSKQTGGLALAAGSNYDLVFDAVAADLGSFYSLGYRPAGDDRGRSVDVRVKRPGLKVRFRRSVAVRPLADEVADAVVANAFVTPSRNELAVSLHAAGAKNASRRLRTVPLEIRVAADQLALIPDGDAWIGGITVLFSTAEPKGRFSEIDKRKQPIRMNAKPNPGEYVSFNVDLIIRTNEQVVSVAVIDDVSKSVGYARETIGKIR